MRGSGVSGKHQLWVSPGGSTPRDVGCSNSSLYFSSFPKTSPPCSGLGSRHEARGSVAGTRASPTRCGSGGRWRREGAARCLPLQPAACEWRQGCVIPAARFWMKSHQWAFLWNRLAMAGVKLQAWLSPFFCLPRLPPPPCALDAGCAYLPLGPGFVRAVGEGAEPGAQLGAFGGSSCSWLCPGLQSTGSGSVGVRC